MYDDFPTFRSRHRARYQRNTRMITWMEMTRLTMVTRCLMKRNRMYRSHPPHPSDLNIQLNLLLYLRVCEIIRNKNKKDLQNYFILFYA